jgi:acetyl esterase/lipase
LPNLTGTPIFGIRWSFTASRAVKKLPGIDEDYYVAVRPDPTQKEMKGIWTMLLGLTAAHQVRPRRVPWNGRTPRQPPQSTLAGGVSKIGSCVDDSLDRENAIMRTVIVCLGLVVILAHAVSSTADTTRTTLDVWPGKVPGEVGTVGEEKAKTATLPDGTSVTTSLTNVSKPTLTVCRPETTKNTGVAVVVFPGGGYTNLAWDHEGEQVARWLNSVGITAAVLKYRVPRREGTSKDTPPVQALMDAQRAISLVRSKAADWGVDPKRIGVLGFSAGGHLAAWSATNFDRRAYDKIDATDDETCRPDFAVMIYPGGVVKRGTTDLSPEIRVTPQTPPCFFAQAGDDRVGAENSVMMYLALKRAGVPAELHIYASGGHGFGLRPTDKPAATWPKRCEEWWRDTGVLKADAGR